jgi:hypothetical protein
LVYHQKFEQNPSITLKAGSQPLARCRPVLEELKRLLATDEPTQVKQLWEGRL